MKLRGLEARDVKLVTGGSLPVSLGEGLADLEVSATLAKGALTARITAGLRSARLLVEKGKERAGLAGRVDDAVRKALAGISSLTLTAEVSGTPEDFDLKVRSDVDEVLKSAVGGLVRDQLAGFEKDLQEAVGAEVGGPSRSSGRGFGDSKRSASTSMRSTSGWPTS